MKASKIVETHKLGDFLFTKQHIIHIQEDLPIEWIVNELNLTLETGSSSFMRYGIYYGMEGRPFSVDITKFVEGVKKRVNGLYDILEEDAFKEDLIIDGLKKLTKYEGYIIHL